MKQAVATARSSAVLSASAGQHEARQADVQCREPKDGQEPPQGFGQQSQSSESFSGLGL